MPSPGAPPMPPCVISCRHIAVSQGSVKDQGVESRKLVMTGLGEGDAWNLKEMLKN